MVGDSHGPGPARTYPREPSLFVPLVLIMVVEIETHTFPQNGIWFATTASLRLLPHIVLNPMALHLLTTFRDCSSASRWIARCYAIQTLQSSSSLRAGTSLKVLPRRSDAKGDQGGDA